MTDDEEGKGPSSVPQGSWRLAVAALALVVGFLLWATTETRDVVVDRDEAIAVVDRLQAELGWDVGEVEDVVGLRGSTDPMFVARDLGTSPAEVVADGRVWDRAWVVSRREVGEDGRLHVWVPLNGAPPSFGWQIDDAVPLLNLPPDAAKDLVLNHLRGMGVDPTGWTLSRDDTQLVRGIRLQHRTWRSHENPPVEVSTTVRGDRLYTVFWGVVSPARDAAGGTGSASEMGMIFAPLTLTFGLWLGGLIWLRARIPWGEGWPWVLVLAAGLGASLHMAWQKVELDVRPEASLLQFRLAAITCLVLAVMGPVAEAARGGGANKTASVPWALAGAAVLLMWKRLWRLMAWHLLGWTPSWMGTHLLGVAAPSAWLEALGAGLTIAVAVVPTFVLVHAALARLGGWGFGLAVIVTTVASLFVVGPAFTWLPAVEHLGLVVVVGGLATRSSLGTPLAALALLAWWTRAEGPVPWFVGTLAWAGLVVAVGWVQASLRAGPPPTLGVRMWVPAPLPRWARWGVLGMGVGVFGLSLFGSSREPALQLEGRRTEAVAFARELTGIPDSPWFSVSTPLGTSQGLRKKVLASPELMARVDVHDPLGVLRGPHWRVQFGPRFGWPAPRWASRTCRTPSAPAPSSSTWRACSA